MYEERKISLVIRISLPPREATIFAALAPDNRTECVSRGMRALGLLEEQDGNQNENQNENNPAVAGGVG